MKNPFRIFRSSPGVKAPVSKLRTVEPRHPPPLAALEETAPDDMIICLVEPRVPGTVGSGNTSIGIVPAYVPDEKCAGVACCSECHAELIVVCPNGHEGADVTLRELTAPSGVTAMPEPPEEVRNERKSASKAHFCQGCGAELPKSRGRYPAFCYDCNSKKDSKKAAA
jgi:hypothetical protein